MKRFRDRKAPPEDSGRQDRRIPLVHGLQLIVFMALVIAVCAVFYIYRSDLSLANFRRFFSYMDFTGGQTVLKEGSVPLETGLSNIVLPFRKGYAVLNSDTLTYLNAAGGEELSVQLGYERPALQAAEKVLLAYNQGGTGYCVANSYAVLAQEQAEGAILAADLAKNGAFALVTSEPGYRAAVTLYDDKQQQCFKWSTSSYYVGSVAVAPDGKGFVAACLSASGGSFETTLVFFSLDKEEPVATLSLGSGYAVGLCYPTGRTVAAVLDNGLVLCTAEGEPIRQITTEQPLIAFTAVSGSLPVLVTSTLHGGAVVTSYNVGGEEAGSLSLPGEIRFISTAGDVTALMTEDSVYLLDRSMSSLSEPISAKSVQSLRAREDHKVVLVFSDRAELHG